MRGRLPHYVLIGSSLTFLVSLYLHWTVTTTIPFGSIAGWNAFGEIAALLALALASLALAAVLKPWLENTPLGATALALGVFAVLSVSTLWRLAVEQYSSDGVSVHLGLGAYLGLGSAGVACVAAAAVRWGELARRRSIVAAAGQAVALVLLGSMIALALREPQHGFIHQPDPLACLAACLALATWSREGQPGLRLANAAAIATLAANYLWPEGGLQYAWTYEEWLLSACTVALLVLALAGARSLRIGRPSVSEAVTVLAAILVVVSLFLPWNRDFPRGWSVFSFAFTGYLAGGLVILFLVGMAARRRVYAEAAIGAALYVMAAGLTLSGAFIGPATPTRASVTEPCWGSSAPVCCF